MIDAEVIVAGAGLSGLRAARDLADAGRRVVVLEARDRVGGRGRSTVLGDRVVELGGSWFTPEHHEVRAELARYGLGVRDFPAVGHARWYTGGELRHGLPVPWEEIGALERALAAVERDAFEGNDETGSLSAADYVERFDPTPALRDFLLGWWQLMGGAPPQRGAVADALGSIAAHGGMTGLLTCLAHGPVEGWSALAERMAGSAGIEVRLGTALRSVSQDEASVVCTTEDGATLRGRALVLAVPMNCLTGIDFTPPLPEQAQESAGANVGAAVKVLMLAEGVEPHGIAVGVGPGLNWLYADARRDGTTLVTGFGWEDASFDPADRGHVEGALRTFFPEARLVDWAHHDWIADPHSRGTWLTAPAGAAAPAGPPPPRARPPPGGGPRSGGPGCFRAGGRVGVRRLGGGERRGGGVGGRPGRGRGRRSPRRVAAARAGCALTAPSPAAELPACRGQCAVDKGHCEM